MSETRLKTTNIKGKQYVEVNTRIKYFRSSPDFKGWSLETEIIELNDKRAVLCAKVTNQEGRVMATGLAYEVAGSSHINKTSYIENCETSAWGRALGNLGIGIDTSVASYEEVSFAIKGQEQQARTSPTTATAQLLTAFQKVGISGEELEKLQKKPLREFDGDDFAFLRNVYMSISEGKTTIEEVRQEIEDDK